MMAIQDLGSIRLRNVGVMEDKATDMVWHRLSVKKEQ